MKIPQRLSWGGITSITERTTQVLGGWGSRVLQQKTRLRTGAETTQTARTTLRRIFEDRFASEEGVCWAHSTDEETDIHPNKNSEHAFATDERSGYTPKQRAQLCDGFSRIDQLPKKECAGRTRLMRERIYTQTARQETGGTGYLSAIRSFFPAPAIRSL